MSRIVQFESYLSVISVLIGLPVIVATYYQAWKARKEAQQAREGLLYSANCLEFLLNDGEIVNLVPLESLHSLPGAGEIVLLPGAGGSAPDTLLYGAYQVVRVEHVYARVDGENALSMQARLVKTIAHVDAVSAPSVLIG